MLVLARPRLEPSPPATLELEATLADHLPLSLLPPLPHAPVLGAALALQHRGLALVDGARVELGGSALGSRCPRQRHEHHPGKRTSPRQHRRILPGRGRSATRELETSPSAAVCRYYAFRHLIEQPIEWTCSRGGSFPASRASSAAASSRRVTLAGSLQLSSMRPW